MPSNIKEIQSRLLSLGYSLPRFGADGHFGAETETAIQQFQTDQHLPVTGLVDAETEKRLVSLPSTVVSKETFFASLRADGLYGKGLEKSEVDGTEAIIDAFYAAGLSDVHWLAYMLATAWHETAFTMQPIAEYGKGKGKKYGAPTGPHKQAYYGRGYVQLTWDYNYQKAEKELGAPFYEQPELAMDPKHAADIMTRGMVEGWFTGKKLSDYLTDKKTDYVNARRIINGTDKAKEIAAYAERFEACLTGKK